MTDSHQYKPNSRKLIRSYAQRQSQCQEHRVFPAAVLAGWVVVSQSSWKFSYIVPTCGTSTVRKRDISCAFCQSTCDAWGESKTQRDNGFPSNVVCISQGKNPLLFLHVKAHGKIYSSMIDIFNPPRISL